MADPIAHRVAARFIAANEPQELLSREFPSDEALKKYLHDHPKADKSKHTVKKPSGGGDGKSDDGESGAAHLKRLEKIKKEHPERLKERIDGGETGEEHLKRLRKIKRENPELLKRADDLSFDPSAVRVAAMYLRRS
jgi:hypothetical protein